MSERAALLEEWARREALRAATASVEGALTLPTERGGAGIAASDVQRAICRMIDGTPLGSLREVPAVARVLGVDVVPERLAPRELIVLAGIRSGKSLIAAMSAIVATQRVDVSTLGPGEVPRVSVVSTAKDQAAAVYGHVVGQVYASPVLRGLVVGEPTADRLTLRHPSGRPVEIAVVAGSRAASSLVARWLAGAIFDEAPRMVGDEDGVINLDDARTAVLGRILPRGMIMYLGSPWAPRGPVYEWTQESFGRPSERRVVVRAQAQDMHPAWWTDERIEALRAQPGGERAVRVDVLAEFAEPESAMYPAPLVERAMAGRVDADEPRRVGASYVAAMDPATRSNAWTLAVATRDAGQRRVVATREWVPREAPLVPSAVLRDVRGVLERYGLDTVHTDQWSGDALRDIGRSLGVHVRVHTLGRADVVEMYATLGTLLGEGRVSLPASVRLRDDLLAVRLVTTATGVRVELPRTADGRHADMASAVALAVSRWCEEFAVPLDDTTAEAQQRAMREAAVRRVRGPERETHWLGE